MGDGLKLSKDKRHRSSSSLSAVVLDGTRSERKLDLRASIPEVDDQFTLAEAKCDDLQKKIDLVKVLKRKRKVKKRSMTRIVDQLPPNENIPFISVRTQPKKKVSQQAVRLRRFEVPQNPTMGYLDHATVEQHRMIGQVRGITQDKQLNNRAVSPPIPRLRSRRDRADGDATTSYEGKCGQSVQITSDPLGVYCVEDDDGLVDISDDDCEARQNTLPHSATYAKRSTDANRFVAMRRRHVPKNRIGSGAYQKKEDTTEVDKEKWRVSTAPQQNRRRPINNRVQQNSMPINQEERPVVELFSKVTSKSNNFETHPLTSAVKVETSQRRNNMAKELSCKLYEIENHNNNRLREEPPMETKKEVRRHPQRMKYRSRRYELPTVASQMKQVGIRCHCETGNTSSIPFVVGKSTTPSHNIGVNIQQVLNGIKIQQPLSGIPLTIAYHMGLGHIPFTGSNNNVMQSITKYTDDCVMNAIKFGHRLRRLPTYRYMSYNRLLRLFREGDGMVPRFLKAISRPHYFYTSMYNLPTIREDEEAATSKGRDGNQEARQSLAEYAALYKIYQQVEKLISQGSLEPELHRRKEELTKQLISLEEHIRQVQEYQGIDDQLPLRASASTADDTYHHSSFKLNPSQQ